MQVWDFSLERSPVSMDNYASVLHTQRESGTKVRLRIPTTSSNTRLLAGLLQFWFALNDFGVHLEFGTVGRVPLDAPAGVV